MDVLINSARLWPPTLLVDILIVELLEANPDAKVQSMWKNVTYKLTEARLRQDLRMNFDGSIKTWHIRRCGLKVLPELFGAVCVTGILNLGENELSSLPASFGCITVGGHLYLNNNQLRSLPNSFGLLSVGGRLHAEDNQLISLPDSFGSITVGGLIVLSDNHLQDKDIPVGFRKIDPWFGEALFLKKI